MRGPLVSSGFCLNTMDGEVPEGRLYTTISGTSSSRKTLAPGCTWHSACSMSLIASRRCSLSGGGEVGVLALEGENELAASSSVDFHLFDEEGGCAGMREMMRPATALKGFGSLVELCSACDWCTVGSTAMTLHW